MLYLALLAIFLSLLFFLTRNTSSSKRGRLPPGSLGFPILGQSLQLFKAMRDNRGEEWLQERARKYGPISKLSIFGNPTVFLHGQSANKFIYTSNDNSLSSEQPISIRRLIGERSLFELSGEDHKRVRGTIHSFLKPEALKRYVGKMDEEVRLHFKEHWHHNEEIMVMPLMKTLTFNVICTLLFGIERGARRDRLVKLFEQMIGGVSAMPINLPFTRFNKSLRARSQVRDIIVELIQEKREKLDKQQIGDHQDLITCMLNDRSDSSSLLSDEEMVDNCILTMIAGHDTTSILITFLVKLLSEHPHVYETVLTEQEEIARGKAFGELLTWDDLAKMKYTWRVATEALRMYPPMIFSFRKVIKDIELGGYVIPKGYQICWAGCMTQMDQTIFLDPQKFNPQRLENQGSAPPYTYIPFGGGARMCPGNEFTRVETLTMIHYLVTIFNWKLCLEDNVWSREPMPVFLKGLPIKIEIKKSEGFAL